MATKKLQILGSLGNNIYVQNDEPENAPENTIWLDLDEEGGSGGSSIAIQSDWNVTDESDPAYIKNKPFYEESIWTTLAPSTEYSGFAYNSDNNAYTYQVVSTYELTIGNTYRVTWDGVQYECVAQDGSSALAGAIFLGNAVAFGFTGNDEPFIIGKLPNGYTIYFALTDTEDGGTHTVCIEEIDTVMHKIDPKYLPDDIGGSSGSSLPEITTEDAGKVLTVDDTGSVAWSAPEKNVQSDWNVIDEADDAYIKNRPFGVSDVTATTLYENKTAEFSLITIHSDGTYEYRLWEDISDDTIDIWNGAWETATVVWDGVTYECVPHFVDDLLAIGNLNAFGLGNSSDEPFLLGIGVLEGSPVLVIRTLETVREADTTTHTFSLSVNNSVIQKVPAKYLYQSDWNQTDDTQADFIKNKPVSLPTVTTEDAGKFLRVTDEGIWAAVSIPNAEGAEF